MIARRANEYVGDESHEEQGVTRGGSVSVLNVPPRGVQEGDHHPLFKLRQVGTSNHPLTIEGVVVPRGDRLVLQGIEVQEQKAFSATVALSHDKWIAYRPDQDKLRTEAIASSGVMLGLSSSKMPFVALFEIFAVPQSSLPEAPSPEDLQAFDVRYEFVKDAAGVRTLEETVEALNRIGIPTSADQLTEIRKRSSKTPSLKPF